jgi:hypothetical protein
MPESSDLELTEEEGYSHLLVTVSVPQCFQFSRYTIRLITLLAHRAPSEVLWLRFCPYEPEG